MNNGKAVMQYACGLLLLLIATGCATTPGLSTLKTATGSLPVRAEVADVPFFPQKRYQCGPAALASMLGWSGTAITPEALVPQVYLPEKQGSLQAELKAASRRRHKIPYQIGPHLETLLAELAAGHPVLVLQNIGLSWYPKWHYAVAIAYDLEAQTLTLHSGLNASKSIPLALFDRTWRRADRWAMVLMTADRLPATADERSYIRAVSELERLEAWEISRHAYKTALTRWTDSEYALLGLGNSSYHLGQLSAAEEIYRAALVLHPSSAALHNNLAQVLLDLGRPIEARRHARKAVLLGGDLSDSYRKTLEAIPGLP